MSNPKPLSYECHCGWQSMTKPKNMSCPDCGKQVWDSPMRGMAVAVNKPKELAEKWISEQPVFNSAVDIFLAGYNAANEWVECSEQLPTDFKPTNGIVSCTSEYQLYDQTYGVSKGWLKRWDRDNEDTLIPRKKGDYIWECQHNNFTRVTHYRPLPEKPKS